MTKPKLIRTHQVLTLTGWNRSYLDKLRDRGVIKHTWQPYRNAWRWYDEAEILALVRNGSNTRNEP